MDKSKHSKKGSAADRSAGLFMRKPIARTTEEDKRGLSQRAVPMMSPIDARIGEADVEEQTDIRRSKDKRNQQFQRGTRQGRSALPRQNCTG
jgi:hypothetical protein